MGLFGSGKVEKHPFRVPPEVAALRMRIETEGRERYPSLDRYTEIVRDAKRVYRFLDDMILKKDHAEEASRTIDDIRKKLEGLSKKIEVNMQEAKKENKQDYVESNIDYLERKSMRNNAKTIFTKMLDAIEAVERFTREGKLDHSQKIESVVEDLFRALSDLNNNFFKEHGKDMEIQALKEKTLQKLAAFDALFQENRARFSKHGLDTRVESSLDTYRKK